MRERPIPGFGVQPGIALRLIRGRAGLSFIAES
jgi:hypothetical protein